MKINLLKTKLIVSMAFAMLFSLNSQAQLPNRGLVAYYPFNNSATNVVTGNFNGTVSGAIPSVGRDTGNVCYSFNGADKITIPSSFDFLPRTVNLWFNANPLANYNDWRFIYESDNANLQKGLLELVVRNFSGKLCLFVNAGNCRDTIEINTGTWYNANLFVDSSKRMKLHLNGVLVSDKPFTSFLKSVSGSTNVVIGAGRFESERYFTGKIDDIAIYDRELSQAEIDTIYNGIHVPPPPPPVLDSLVAFYPFDGNTNDTSGNNLHGTSAFTVNAPNRFNAPSTSYRFNGLNSYVEFPSDFDFAPRTVNLWFKADNDDYSDWKFIFESDHPMLKKGLLELVLREEMGQLLLYINAGSGRDTVDIQTNIWYNATLVVDSNKTMKFYLNGVLVSNKTFASNLTSTNGINKVLLGTDRNKISRFFKGQIDDVRFYSYELNQTEINNIVNEGLMVCNVTVTDTLVINVNLVNSSPVAYNNSIKIFPNPTKDKINIDCGSQYLSLQNSSIRITNSLGQAMFDHKIDQQYFELNMNNWTGKGLYLVYIVDSKGNITDVKKILLQ